MEVRAYDSQGNLKVLNGLSVGSLSAGTTRAALGEIVFSNSNGVSFGLNGLTMTASAAAGGGGSLNVSAGTTSNNLTALTFSNANGVSFGLNGSVITAQHNAITTARASNDGVGLATAQTNVTWTVNSAGISLNAGGYAGTGFTSTTTAGTAVVATQNTAGLSMGIPAYITTAMLSNAATISNIRVSAGTTSNLLSAITFGNGNGVSFGINASTITASHNGLTTARASNDGVGLATAQTNVTWTVNSAGISLNAGGYAGTTTGFAGANISGSMTHNTDGLNLSLSVAAPGAAAENNWVHLLGANTLGNTTASGSTLGFSAGPGLTLSGTNGSQIVFSVGAYLTTAALSDHSHGNPTLALTNLSGTTASASNGFTLSLSAGAAGGGVTYSGYNPFEVVYWGTNAYAQGSLSMAPYKFPAFQYDRYCIPLNFLNASNLSGSQTISYWVGLYTRNASTLSLLYSASGSTAMTQSGTVGSYSLRSGMRLFTIADTRTITAGDYWLAVINRTTSGGANASLSGWHLSQVNTNFLGHFGSSHNTTYQMNLGLGIYSATTSALPASIGFTQLRGSDVSILRRPIVIFASSTV